MRTFSNLITLIGARGLSILGFFTLPLVMSQNDFKSYVLYFSTWQILSQLLGMQLGATLFRYGMDRKYTSTINLLVGQIQRALLVIPPLLLLAVLCRFYLMAALVMSLQFAIFNIYSDYARSFLPEHRIFRLQLLPGFLYLVVTALCLTLKIKIPAQALLLLEWLSYYVMTHFLYRLISVRFAGSRGLSTSQCVRRIYGAWRKVSLPLVPNNLIWYFYFNAPQIFGYYLVSDDGVYNQQAILFRAVVALSTLSSTIVLVFQKKVVLLFEDSLERYHRMKMRALCFLMPGSLVAILSLAAFLRSALNLDAVAYQLPVQYRILPGYLVKLSLLFWLFLAVFSLSHYFVAEKKMNIVAPSMVIGVVLYFAGMISGLSFEMNFSAVALASLTLSLFVTFLLRYLWLLSHGVKSRC